MFSSARRRVLPAVVLAAILGAIAALVAAADTIDPAAAGARYAWGENVGWINAKAPTTGNPGVTVSGTKLTGYMWGENIGWINMNCSNNGTCAGPAVNWGVTNDGAGNLGGYAWGENVGWISFSCKNTVPACNGPSGNWAVTINPATGLFGGKAYGENIGWLVFDYSVSSANRVVTDDGDGVAPANDNCKFDANPTQTNTDLANNTAPPNGTNRPGADALGDACDDDIDGDGYTNAQEVALGKNPSIYCDVMRADVDGDHSVSILDLANVAAHFLQSVPTAPDRDRQDYDNSISILDLAKMANLFLRNVNSCT